MKTFKTLLTAYSLLLFTSIYACGPYSPSTSIGPSFPKGKVIEPNQLFTFGSSINLKLHYNNGVQIYLTDQYEKIKLVKHMTEDGTVIFKPSTQLKPNRTYTLKYKVANRLVEGPKYFSEQEYIVSESTEFTSTPTLTFSSGYRHPSTQKLHSASINLQSNQEQLFLAHLEDEQGNQYSRVIASNNGLIYVSLYQLQVKDINQVKLTLKPLSIGSNSSQYVYDNSIKSLKCSI